MRAQVATVQAENEALKQAATENTRYYAGAMNEAGAKIGRIEKELEATNTQLAERDAELATLAADREELAQLKKETKEAVAEFHREGRSIELPEPADLLNQLKGRRKKSKADLADVEAILELMGDCDDG